MVVFSAERYKIINSQEIRYANEGSTRFLFSGSQMPVESFLNLKPDEQNKLIKECGRNFTITMGEQGDKLPYPYTCVPSIETLATWLCETPSFSPDSRKGQYPGTFGWAVDNVDIRKSREENEVISFGVDDIGPKFAEAWHDYCKYVGIRSDGLLGKYGEAMITGYMSDSVLKGLLTTKVRSNTMEYVVNDPSMRFKKSDAGRAMSYRRENREFCRIFDRQFK